MVINMRKVCCCVYLFLYVEGLFGSWGLLADDLKLVCTDRSHRFWFLSRMGGSGQIV